MDAIRTHRQKCRQEYDVAVAQLEKSAAPAINSRTHNAGSQRSSQTLGVKRAPDALDDPRPASKSRLASPPTTKSRPALATQPDQIGGLSSRSAPGPSVARPAIAGGSFKPARANPFGPALSRPTSTSSSNHPRPPPSTRDGSNDTSSSTRASSRPAAPPPKQTSSSAAVARFFEPQTFLLLGVPPTSCWWCGLIGSPSYRVIKDAYVEEDSDGRNVLVRLDSGQACAGCAAFHVRELSSAENGAGMSERMVQATRKLMDRAVEIRGRSVKKEEGK